MMNPRRIDPNGGTIDGEQPIQRRLSDLHGVFVDDDAYSSALVLSDPVVYTVASMQDYDSDGDLHYGLGTLMPGRIGREFYMTKGHIHTWRDAAEVYIGMDGFGLMLLQNELTHESHVLPLERNMIVYVPAHTAHRTINVGTVPLVYLGIYPAKAGHDYAAIAKSNFDKIVVADEHSSPVVLDRSEYLATQRT